MATFPKQPTARIFDIEFEVQNTHAPFENENSHNNNTRYFVQTSSGGEVLRRTFCQWQICAFQTALGTKASCNLIFERVNPNDFDEKFCNQCLLQR